MGSVETAQVVGRIVFVVQPDVTDVELGALGERIHVADLPEVRAGVATDCRTIAGARCRSTRDHRARHTAHVARLRERGTQTVRSDDSPIHADVPCRSFGLATDDIPLLARVLTTDANR